MHAPTITSLAHPAHAADTGRWRVGLPPFPAIVPAKPAASKAAKPGPAATEGAEGAPVEGAAGEPATQQAKERELVSASA